MYSTSFRLAFRVGKLVPVRLRSFRRGSRFSGRDCSRGVCFDGVGLALYVDIVTLRKQFNRSKHSQAFSVGSFSTQRSEQEKKSHDA